MTNQVNAIVGCLLVGEYVDEAECPTSIEFNAGEPVRPQLVAEYLDQEGRAEELRPDRQSV